MPAQKKAHPIEFERRSLELTPAQWAALERLAAKAGACPATGPNAGQPSWRTWIKQQADAEVATQAKADAEIEALIAKLKPAQADAEAKKAAEAAYTAAAYLAQLAKVEKA